MILTPPVMINHPLSLSKALIMFLLSIALTLIWTRIVQSHMALWHPSMYGFNEGDGYLPVEPLANKPFSEWWFHGYTDKPPADSEVMQLPAGQTVTVEIACNKEFTSYGSRTSDPASVNSACPDECVR